MSLMFVSLMEKYVLVTLHSFCIWYQVSAIHGKSTYWDKLFAICKYFNYTSEPSKYLIFSGWNPGWNGFRSEIRVFDDDMRSEEFIKPKDNNWIVFA